MVKIDIYSLPLEDQVRVLNKTKKLTKENLPFGYRIGEVIELNGGKYIIESSHFGKPGQLQLRELVPPSKADSDLEREMEKILKELGFKGKKDYEKQYNVSRYWIDFAFVKEKIAVEPGAKYWHSKERDAGKGRALNKRGWEVLWFNEDEIYHDRERIKYTVKEVVGKKRGIG